MNWIRTKKTLPKCRKNLLIITDKDEVFLAYFTKYATNFAVSLGFSINDKNLCKTVPDKIKIPQYINHKNVVFWAYINIPSKKKIMTSKTNKYEFLDID